MLIYNTPMVFEATPLCNENGNLFTLQLYSFLGNMKTVSKALHIGVATGQPPN
jgi:hypothetical protein